MTRAEPRPPRTLERLVSLAVPEREVDSVLGDLEEEFARIVRSRGEGRARLWYALQALLFAIGFTLERARRIMAPSSTGPGRGRGRTERPGVVSEWSRELRLAARSLLRKPGFTAICLMTLAVGVGANTAIFSIVRGALLRPLAFDEPERIVWLSEWFKGSEVPGGSSMNPANFVDLRSSLTTLEHVSPYQPFSANLSGGEEPERVDAVRVGHGFLAALRVEPRLGRGFLPEDDTPDSSPVVILTHEIWESRFAADPGLVGRTIELEARPYEVIGVLPPGFDFPYGPRVLVPFGFEGAEHSRGGRNLNGVARLAPGVTLEQARSELTSAYEPLERDHPDQNENWSAWADPLQTLTTATAQKEALTLLSWSVVLVLLVAAINLANMLLVRAEGRQRELALRVAVGADRAGLVPHFMSEALLIAVAGGALGVLAAYVGVDWIKSAFGPMLPRAEEIRVDTAVLAFGVGVSVLAGALSGALPLLRTNVGNLGGLLKDGARGDTRRGRRLRQGLVVGELALSVVLLTTAGLLIGSFVQVAGVDVGLEAPEEVLVAEVSLSSGRYGLPEDRVRFFAELLPQVEAMPGVESVGLTSRMPLFGGTNFTSVPVVGQPERVAGFVEWRIVSPGFFETVGIRLEEGRLFHPADAEADTLQTIVVTRELATQLFGSGSALGHRIDPFGDGRGVEIIGVVSDLRDFGHERPAPPGMYAPYGPPNPSWVTILMVRAAGDPLALVPALRDVIQRVDDDLPLFGVRTLADVVDQRLGARRFSITLLTSFAAVAVLLAAIGVYGLMSYAVAQRTREMGVRFALGAGRVRVMTLVLGNGARLTIVGLLLGWIGAAGAARLVRTQLFEVGPSDPVTYLAAAAILGVVAMVAAYLPARRASATDPLEALRHE